MSKSVPDFPTVLWGDTRATFVPDGAPLPPGNTVATLVFALEGGQFVLADITGRGWCIPGGRLEAGENEEQAARREVWEEIGATLGTLHLLGHCVLFDPVPASQKGLPAGPSEPSNSPARLIAMYRANILTRTDVPGGSESQGVRVVAYEAIPACYFTWDALMEAMFRYANKDEG